ASDASDAQEPLGIEHESGGREPVLRLGESGDGFGLSGGSGGALLRGLVVGHVADSLPLTEGRETARQSSNGPEGPLEPLAPSPYASVIYSALRIRSKGGPKQPSMTSRRNLNLPRSAG